MAETPKEKKSKFLPVFGITLGATLVLTLLYSLITGMSKQHWADSLCAGSLLLGVASIIPLFFDAGRGFVMATKLGATEDERDAAMVEEKQRREQGMAISFALGAATFVIGIFSFILSFI